MKTCNRYAPRGILIVRRLDRNQTWIPSPSAPPAAFSRRGIKKVKWVALVDNVWSRTDQLGGRVSLSCFNFKYFFLSLMKCMIWMGSVVLEMGLNTKPLLWKHLSCLESLWCTAAWTAISAGRNTWNIPGESVVLLLVNYLCYLRQHYNWPLENHYSVAEYHFRPLLINLLSWAFDKIEVPDSQMLSD